jgi:hypothetical protein
MPGKLAQAASAALAQASAKLAGDTTPGTLTPLPPASAEIPKTRADALRKKYRSAERRVDSAREALDAAKADILAEMGAAEVLQVAETGKPFAEHKTVVSLTFDQTRFRSEHPDEAASYMKERLTRRFRVLT